MSGKPLTTIELDNGLSMEIIDRSRKIAADRWYIEIVVRIEIAIEKQWFSSESADDVKFEDIHHRLGDTVVFENKNVRNFVSDDIKFDVVEKICKRITALGDQYYGHPDFPVRYILKCYRDRLKNRY